MHSSLRAGVVLSSLMLFSCGAFGPKEDPHGVLDIPSQSGGCLDQARGRLELYVRGEISSQEWGAVWDCTSQALRLLNRFGNGDGGFSQSDLHALITSLLLTDTPLPPDFVPTIFQLKASLLGGSTQSVTPEEVEEIISVVRVVKEQTLKILPLLQERKGGHAPELEIRLSHALSAAIARLGAEFTHQGTAPFTREALEAFVRDLSQIYRAELPEYLGGALLEAKALLAGGSNTEIEAHAWHRVFASLGAIGAPVFALIDADRKLAKRPNEFGEFIVRNASDVEVALEDAAELHGGKLPYEKLDALIAALPDSFFKVSRTTLSKLFRVVAGKILASGDPGGIDRPSLQRAIGHLNRWKSGKTLLDAVFAQEGLDSSGASREELLVALRHLRERVAEATRPDVDRLVSLVIDYHPLFLRDDDEEITLAQGLPYTLTHLTQIHWMNLASELLIRSYSSLPGRTALSPADFQRLYADVYEVGVELNKIDPTVPNFDLRRVRELDYFLPNSDGNGLIGLGETTYYFAFLKSISALSNRMRADIEELCKISDEPGPMGWKWMDAACFRNAYFENVDKYWNHAPAMLAYFNTLDKSQHPSFRWDIENGARLGHYSENPVGGYDTKAFATVLHLVETLFFRFDFNGDGRLNTDETLAAQRVVSTLVAQLAKLDPSQASVLEAIFTYIVKYGAPPDRDAVGVIKIGSWLAIRPFWNIDAGRAEYYKGLYLFSSFSLDP